MHLVLQFFVFSYPMYCIIESIILKEWVNSFTQYFSYSFFFKFPSRSGGKSMPFKRFIQNDKGISLIEILISIVLLSILITSFLTFFPQVSSFNQKTDERLTSVTLAKSWLVQAQNSESTLYKQLINLTDNPSASINTSDLDLLTNINRNSDVIELIFKENNYFIHLYLYYRQETLKGANTLYKIRIDVFDEQDKLNSHIYGYITKK